jgi:hypothetical protein
MAELSTTVEIDAPAAVVWAILTDTAAWPDWNPFLTRVEGDVVAGARVRIRFEPPGGRPMTMRPRLLVVDPPHELRWLGRLGLPGLFDGEHRFLVEPLGPDRVRVTQSEQFGGVFVPLLRTTLRKTERGFGLMNDALKARAEAQVASAAAAARAATNTGSQSGENGGA